MRLHAAADALFPPEGEEKKSKVEGGRHRDKGYMLSRGNVKRRHRGIVEGTVSGRRAPPSAVPSE